jgi:Fe2+ or Zn2+ uptake regulation protein
MRDEVACDSLRTAGLRITAPRLAVLAWLREHPHATADVVVTGVRELLGKVSVQAVYDVLNVFTERDLVRRIENAGHPAQFETRVKDNHHHLVCQKCGHTTDIDCGMGRAPCLTPSDSAGFLIDEAEVVLWGLCPDCAIGERPA